MISGEQHFDQLVSALHTQIDMFGRAYKRAHGMNPEGVPFEIHFRTAAKSLANFLRNGNIEETRNE
jgi:hypothetical protein